MTEDVISSFIDDYVTWLRQKIQVDKLGGEFRIGTPFLNHLNDAIDLYILPKGSDFNKNGSYWLTDLGETITELEQSGSDFSSHKRSHILTQILAGFGVELSPNMEIRVEFNHKNFPQKKHNILQAILAVDDMFMLANERVKSLFLDDVLGFLKSNNISYVPNVKLSGKSQIDHRVDAIIPGSSKHNERLIKVTNNLSSGMLKSVLFTFDDIRKVREPFSAYIIFNDKINRPSVKNLKGLENYEVTPIAWSQIREELPLLAN